MSDHIGTSESAPKKMSEIETDVSSEKLDEAITVEQINILPEDEGLEDVGSDLESEDEGSQDGFKVESRSVKSEEFSSEREVSSEGSEDDCDLSYAPKVEAIYFGQVNPLEGEPCLCRDPISLDSSLSLLKLMENIDINFDNHSCIIDNVIRVYNYIFKNTNTSANRYRVAFADLFYRVRHETFFRILCKTLNLPAEHSDRSFREFGIDSDRTPDLIIKKEGVIYIIEVAVTSSMEKAAQSKGTEQSDFESKYAKEISMFTDIGVPTSYLPIFFDMTNPDHPYTREQLMSLSRVFNINRPYNILLSQFTKSMAILTSNFKEHLILPSTILFSNILKINRKHDSISFLYRRSRTPIKTNNYREMIISPFVYSKFCNEKTHLFWLIDNSTIKPDKKAVFCVAGNSNRITLEMNKDGALIETLRDYIINCDYTKLFDMVRIKVGSKLIPATENEQGVKIYESTIHKAVKYMEEIPLICNHTSTEIMDTYSTDKYKEMIDNYTSDNYHSIHFDPDYEKVLINSMCDFDYANEDGVMFGQLPSSLLGNIKTKGLDIDLIFSEISIRYSQENRHNDTLPIKRLKMKQPFLIPIADLNESSYSKIEYKNVSFINDISDKINDTNPYTSLILKNVNNPSYSMYSKTNPSSKGLLDLESSRYAISNAINRLQKDLLKKGASDGEYKISKTKDPDYLNEFSRLKQEYGRVVKEIRLKRKSEGAQQNISYLKLPTKNKGSNLRRLYDIEMSHFKDKSKQSTIEGVGLINNIEDDYRNDLKIFNSVCNLLCDDRGFNPDKILHSHISEDAQLIKDLKEKSLNDYQNLIEQVTRSCLGHATALVSRLAHSLMFYSQLPFSSDYIRVDNLGYKNILLIVRGGKKIFKSKSSKLYRLIYPISEELLPWYLEGHTNKGSFLCIEIAGVHYAITPWSMMHESILTDSMSFHHRVMSFAVLNLNPLIDLRLQFDKVAMNVLLAFHNRRQTEVILANLRYILLSTLGDFTGVTQILDEFFGFNYDRFQAFIRNSILLCYPSYFKTLQSLKDKRRNEGNVDINISDFNRTRLKNIFTGSVLTSVEELALMIYSTFLMTKAPYQKLVERANNIKGILSIHELFDKEVGLDLHPEEQLKSLNVENTGDFREYTRELFSNDFKFDPKFCALVGGFIDNVFKIQGDQDEIEAAWLRILNQPWDEMATSTGLRGDYGEIEDFWGQKGYFVIYKKLLNQDGFKDKLLRILTDDYTDDDKRRFLRSLNESFISKVDTNSEFLIFHAVDKVQWRGGREIYVMDINTKILQQPIEKFMAFLCKKLDNELISIPSDRRAQVIHHSIFEKDIPVKGNITWFLTLDCSKWAPKSIFIKFVIMLLNMSVIPNSFKTHFMNYIDKLYSKRIYFNKGEVEVLLKNPLHSEKVQKYLKVDDKVGGYYLEMPYSWVMGIFNYTSSFLHASNQKYFSYLLTKTTMLSYKEETSMVMFAHSDDSGGRMSVSNEFMAQRALIFYEVYLKSCNHLLSKKKSVVSRIYFEILSVIYLFKKLLALLPKFLGGLRFLPTDKGPSQDLLQSYSKSIEVMVAGGDFSIAYIVLKVYSHLVWKFYLNKDPTSVDYERPVQYMGMPDAHPLFVLLCGSDADILRLLRNGADLSSLVTFVNTMSRTSDGDGPIKPLKFEIKVKGIKRGFEDHIDSFKNALDSWSIRNVNFHNTAMNTLSFLRKLNDSGFVGSLVNESTTRRISRAFYMRFSDSAITVLGNVKLQHLIDSMVLCQSYKSNKKNSINQIFNSVLTVDAIKSIESEFEVNLEGSQRTMKLLTETLKSPLKIYRYLDMIGLGSRKIINVSRTLKPTLLQLVKSSKVFSNLFDPASLVSYMKEKEWSWALSDVRNLHTSAAEVEKFMAEMGFDVNDIEPDLLLRVCRTYGRNNTKSIYLYSRVPGEVRQIKTYSAFLTFLSVNSFYNKEIQGLTLKISDRDTSKEYLEPNLREEVYVVNDIISVLRVLVEKCGADFVNNLVLREYLEIGWAGGSITDIISHIEALFYSDVRYNVVKCQVLNLKHLLGISNGDLDQYMNSGFYTFLTSQKMRGGWYGKGEVYISIESNYYSFILNNNELTALYTNQVGKLPLHHSEFIRDIIQNLGIQFHSMKKPKVLDYNKLHFGLDNSDDVSVFYGREIKRGIIATILDARNCFVDSWLSYTVDKVNNEWMTIKRGDGGDTEYKKINFIPVRKGEIVPIMQMLLDAKQFEYKLIEAGLNDFEEFVYTEILVEYGKNLVTDFDAFADNYQSSMLYEIFQDVHKKGYSKISRKLEFCPLPAAEGSLLRVLIDYSAFNNAGILKVPRAINSTMMQMRTEMSEHVVALMGDKASEYFKQIYSQSEQKEISDHYNAISSSSDPKVVKNSVIKLMTYWGYGSLVNSIEAYSLKKTISNYIYFNKMNEVKYRHIFSGAFIDLAKGLKALFEKWRPMYGQLDLVVPSLKRFIDPDHFFVDYIHETVMSTYHDSVTIGAWISLYPYIFATMLLTYMQDEDFIADLQCTVNSVFLLSSLPVSWSCRYDFISVINILRESWANSNITAFELNFVEKNQRLPDHIPNFKSKLKTFDIVIPPARSYYHGFLDDSILSYIYGKSSIRIGEVNYRLNNRVSLKSKVAVYMETFLKHPAPLNEDFMDHENYEEILAEHTMDPVDDDTILEYVSEIPKPHYVETTVRKQTFKTYKNILAKVNWIVNPFTANSWNQIKYYRQVGENIVVITDVYMSDFIKVFPNSGVRLINLSKVLRKRVPPFFAYYSLHKDLKRKELIDQLLGGVEYSINQVDSSIIKSNYTRSVKGFICEPGNAGMDFEELIEGSAKDMVLAEIDGCIRVVKKEETEGEGTKSIQSMDTLTMEDRVQVELEHKYKETSKLISEIEKSNLINKESVNRLKDKYIKKAINEGVSTQVLLSSIATEADLIHINDSIISGKSDISLEDQKKMFLSPEYFGVARAITLNHNDPIKNKKVRSEINSLHSDLSRLVGSNSLNLSREFKKVVEANYKMWTKLYKGSSFKKENKGFVLTLFSSLCNNTLVSDSSADDQVWQEISNKITVYLAQDDDDEDDDNDFSNIFSGKIGARLRYRAEGT